MDRKEKIQGPDDGASKRDKRVLLAVVTGVFAIVGAAVTGALNNRDKILPWLAPPVSSTPATNTQTLPKPPLTSPPSPMISQTVHFERKPSALGANLTATFD